LSTFVALSENRPILVPENREGVKGGENYVDVYRMVEEGGVGEYSPPVAGIPQPSINLFISLQ